MVINSPGGNRTGKPTRPARAVFPNCLAWSIGRNALSGIARVRGIWPQYAQYPRLPFLAHRCTNGSCPFIPRPSGLRDMRARTNRARIIAGIRDRIA
jgi:hypothetical protein